jgi:Zn-dependent peptidase ImmA (M78 family)
MIDFNKIIIPSYTGKDIERLIADKIKSHRDYPPIDVDLIAEKLGFDLIPLHGLKNFSSTDAYLSSNKKEIAYDPDVVSVRIRFSVAHELGHYFLHHDIIQEVRFMSYDEWKMQLTNIPGWFWGKVETQANLFAGKLLAPEELIISCIPTFSEQLKLAKKHIPDDINSVREYLAVPLARIFEVSDDVMRFRLNTEKINPFDYI